MGKGDHCAVFGCNNDRRYPDHVGLLRFYSPLNAKDKSKWQKLLNRKDFKVAGSTKICSNHFVSGYRSKDCPDPTLYMKGYEIENTKKRPAPRERSDALPRRKRKRIKSTESDKSDISICSTANYDKDDESVVISEECYIEQGNSSENIEPVIIEPEEQPDLSDKDDSFLFEDDDKKCFCDGDLVH